MQVWPEGSNWYDIRQIEVNDFTETGESTNVIRVYLVWGLGLQDRSKCHFTDFKCKGQTVLDEDFTLNSPQCQTSMLVSRISTVIYIAQKFAGILLSHPRNTQGFVNPQSPQTFQNCKLLLKLP